MNNHLNKIGGVSGRRSAGVWLAAAVLWAVTAYASEGGGHHTPSILDLGRYWVNFLIFVGILYSLLKNVIPAAYAQRRAQIGKEVEEGQRQLREATEMLVSAEQKLAAVEEDMRRLVDDIHREASREAAEIIREAETRARTIGQQARQTAAFEQVKAEKLVEEEVVALAVAKAEERIRRELTQEADRGIREASLSGVRTLVA